MIFDFDQISATELPACHVVVVGGGPIGVIAAVQLARSGHEVVMLEAGGRTAQPLNDGHPHNGFSQARVRLLGGNCIVWGGTLLPYTSIDLMQPGW